MTIEALEPGHLDALRRFLEALPEGDRTFIKEDLDDPACAAAWVRGEGRARRWAAVDEADREILGVVFLARLTGWSSHVGEIRLVVAEAARGRGVGRALARHAVVQSAEAGLSKLVVEVVAEQEPAVRMFTDLGFQGEALLGDHIKDRGGALRDVLVLAHYMDDNWSTMESVGLGEEVAG
jgi:ribosomal protein S18 acetylase RimI-like enzyme